MIPAAVILLLAGVFAWSMVGTMETTAEVTLLDGTCDGLIEKGGFFAGLVERHRPDMAG